QAAPATGITASGTRSSSPRRSWKSLKPATLQNVFAPARQAATNPTFSPASIRPTAATSAPSARQERKKRRSRTARTTTPISTSSPTRSDSHPGTQERSGKEAEAEEDDPVGARLNPPPLPDPPPAPA